MSRIRTTAGAVGLVALIVLSTTGAGHAADTPCDPDVKQTIDAAHDKEVQRKVDLANDVYSRAEKSFSDMSCIENIMNTHYGWFLNVPSLDDIFGKLKNKRCQEVQDGFNRATGPLTQTFSAKLPMADELYDIGFSNFGFNAGIGKGVSGGSAGSGSTGGTIDPGARLGEIMSQKSDQ